MDVLRALRRSPGFTALSVGILALGIGAATAVIEVVDAAFLRPLPFAHASSLVTLWQVSGGTDITVDGADFLDWNAQADSFEGMSAVSARGFTLTGADRPERVEGAIVSAGFFALLQTPALLGRAAGSSGARTAALSESFWRSRFGADPSVVGRTITLDGEPVELTAVMPARFRYPPSAQLWVSARTRVPEHPTYPIDPEHDRARHYLTVLARLRPGVTLARAEAALQAVQARIAADHPDEEKGISARMVPLREHLFGKLRPVLWGLCAVAALLFFVAWANAAHLFLARAVSREHETAVRMALGATRAVMWRRFFSEALLVSTVAACIGLLLGSLVAPALVRLSPQAATLPSPAISARVLLAAAALVLACGTGLGLLEALQPFRGALALQDGARTGSGGSRHARLRSALLMLEVSLSVVLLVGAGLLSRSLRRVASVDPGFVAAGVLAADVPLAAARHPDRASQLRFAREVLRRLRADPLIDSAGFVSRLPFSPSNTVGDLALPGRESEAFPCDLRLASDGYFETLRIPLREGRTFSEADSRGEGPPAVVLNQAAAHRAFGGGSALGRQVLVWGESVPSEVVGVVGDVHHLGLEGQPRPEAWRPLGAVGWTNLMLVVRGKVPAPQLAAPLRQAIWGIDGDQPIVHLEPMQERIDASLSLRRFGLMLVSLTALVAALLAVAGVHGVTSYLVAQRTREIGVRMALGATAARVMAELMRDTMFRVGVGCVAGLAAAAALAHALRGFLFGVAPVDGATFGAVALLLAVTALTATLLGSVRVTRLDPARALRE
jgi:putative ABC transport system permease protein